MTQAQKLAALQRWRDAFIESNALIVPLVTGSIISVDGPMIKALILAQDALTAATAELVGDQSDWLNWHYVANAMGANSYEAGPAGQERPIKTLEDLLWVIEVVA